MTRQFKKQIENQSQSGRSMVEMLGVLAIIAILSIGGIVGYKLAMNYYQADQIANEINLMRNDLKVKYALGNEELLLGDPYDDTPENEHYSGHLSTQYDRYPVDYDCIIRGNKESKNELYNCREADAYYIAVGNISKGVCKPLTTLVAAMDGRLEMDINGISYTGGDSCDENNEIYVEFDAEDVNGNYDSNRPDGWCGKDGDCDASRPICDIENNECVECTEDTDCADSGRPRCNVEQGSCESCPPEKPKWNGHTCVECVTSADCTNLDKPNCNTGTNTCEACPPEKPVWYNNTCVECETNEDCLAKGIDEPICNLDTNTCEPCPNEGEAWNEEQQKCAPVVCTTNAECFEHLDQNYYCDKTPEGACGENETGICKKFELDLHGTVNGVSIDASAKIGVNYWNDCRICEANAGKDGADCSKNDYLSPYMLTPDFLNCADKYDPSTFYGSWYCHEKTTGNRNYEKDNVSHNIQDLRALLGCPRLPEENKDQCNAALNLAVYNKEHPCSVFRIGLDDNPSQVGWGVGDMTWCDVVSPGGRKHPHGGIICKK